MLGNNMYDFTNMMLEQISMVISVVFISALIGVTIYVLAKSWEEGKERYLEREEIEKQEQLNRKRLENLKLENLEINLTNEDVELLNLMTKRDGTIKGTLRGIVREHLKS